MFKSSCSSSTPSSASSLLQSSNQNDQVKYKGVRKRKWGKWVSEIRLPNSRERIWLGSYDSAEKAARAFDAALFCLRGKNAKFNFADNPPDLVGGRSLTPAEIQVIASQHAKEYNHEQQPRGEGLIINEKEDELLQSDHQMMESEDTSPISSNSDGTFQNTDTINWSFLDLLEPNIGAAPVGSVPDYGLMLSSLDNLHEDLYMAPHLGSKVDDNVSGQQHGDDQNVDENFSHQSFLWNF
ncbi:hypothetical protein ACH5RR_039439 [Cinchona calisaya]|uniref:AP2/ERF domain-containing protein n=1 Tax=Cinchona calisaya TaxID=153742 RepID=A0ABD2XY86_9GENT